MCTNNKDFIGKITIYYCNLAGIQGDDDSVCREQIRQGTRKIKYIKGEWSSELLKKKIEICASVKKRVRIDIHIFIENLWTDCLNEN